MTKNNLMIQVRLENIKDIQIFYNDENCKQWITLPVKNFDFFVKDQEVIITPTLKNYCQYEYVADKRHYGIIRPSFNPRQFMLDFFPIDTQKHFWYYNASGIYYYDKIKSIEDISKNNPHNTPTWMIHELQHAIKSGWVQPLQSLLCTDTITAT